MQGQVITVNRFCFYILFMALTIIRSYKGKSTLSSRLQYPHRVLTLCCGGMDCTQFVWAFPSDLLAVLWVHFNINCKFVSVLCFNVSVIKPFFSLHMMIFCVIIAFVFLIGLIDCYSVKQVRSHALQSASNRCLAVPVAI